MTDRNETRHKKRKHQNKVRVKLPGIESYEKTLEFAAEGPGRVVVRLERLMGSDRVRITDPKYLSTLVERLEAEEAKSWGLRSRLRKKAEKNRSRQLAIEGLMEPTLDMQDLYEHPVFRVNRVLNRLSLFDQNMSVGATQKIAPIVPIEPFSDDETGQIFKTFSQHQVFHKEVLPYTNSYSRVGSRANITRSSHYEPHPETSAYSAHEEKHSTETAPHERRHETGSKFPKPEENAAQQRPVSPTHDNTATGEKSTKSVYKSNPTHQESKKPSGINLPSRASIKLKEQDSDKRGKNTNDDKEDAIEQGQTEKMTESLHEFMLLYGVPSDANLVRDWQAFQSHLVERVCEETGGSAKELYKLAGEVIGVYDRQLITADDFVATRNDVVKNQRQEMGLPEEEKKEKPPQEIPQQGANQEVLADEENTRDNEENTKDSVEESQSQFNWKSSSIVNKSASQFESAADLEDDVPPLLENQPQLPSATEMSGLWDSMQLEKGLEKELEKVGSSQSKTVTEKDKGQDAQRVNEDEAVDEDKGDEEVQEDE